MHNTGNPLPSKDILDLYDNSETIDNFVNSQENEVPDRFGVKRLTLAGLIKRSMALRNEINDFSGALTFKPEWTDVPMNVSEGVGGEGGALNLQAEALGNRTELVKGNLGKLELEINSDLVSDIRTNKNQIAFNLLDGIFTFCSWNVWGGSSVNNYFGGDFYSGEKFQLTSEYLINNLVTICGMQEVYLGHGVAQDFLSHYPYSHTNFFDSLVLKPGSYGNSITSTLVPYYNGGLKYSSAPSASDKEIRSVVITKYDTPKGKLSVYNTHLSLDGTRQVEMLTELHSLILTDTNPLIIIMGDFNFPNDDKLSQFTNAGFEIVGKNNEFNTNNNGGAWFIDKILFRGFSKKLSAFVVDTPLALGDHKPLFVTLGV